MPSASANSRRDPKMEIASALVMHIGKHTCPSSVKHACSLCLCWRLIGKLAYMELRERIVWARQRSGLTQKQLADRVGISRQAVMQWEQEDGTKSLDAANAIRAAQAMNVDPLWLATGDGSPVGHGVEERTAKYDPDIPREMISAWAKIDQATRRHLLAIIISLANRTDTKKHQEAT